MDSPSWGLVIASALVSTLLCGVVIRWSRQKGWVSKPRPDRFGERSVALMGGLGLMGAFLLATLTWSSRILPGLPDALRTVLWTVSAMTLILVGLGFVDDRRGVDPSTKLSVQAFGALAMLMVLYEALLPDADPIAQVIVLGIGGVFVVGLSNSVNMLDNMDGIAGVSVLLSCAGIGLFSHFLGFNDVALLASLLAGSILGFLVWNAPVVRPARLFMGDCGSLPMGYLLGLLIIWLLILEPRALWLWLAVPLAAAVPLGDTVFVLWRRRVEKRPLMLGGQDHLSHCLVRMGISPSRVFAGFLAASVWTSSGLVVSGVVQKLACESELVAYDSSGMVVSLPETRRLLVGIEARGLPKIKRSGCWSRTGCSPPFV